MHVLSDSSLPYNFEWYEDIDTLSDALLTSSDILQVRLAAILIQLSARDKIARMTNTLQEMEQTYNEHIQEYEKHIQKYEEFQQQLLNSRGQLDQLQALLEEKALEPAGV